MLELRDQRRTLTSPLFWSATFETFILELIKCIFLKKISGDSKGNLQESLPRARVLQQVREGAALAVGPRDCRRTRLP